MAVTNIIIDALSAMKELEGFQRLLARCPTAADRKHLVMEMHSFGALTDDETGLLITSMMLETA